LGESTEHRNFHVNYSYYYLFFNKYNYETFQQAETL